MSTADITTDTGEVDLQDAHDEVDEPRRDADDDSQPTIGMSRIGIGHSFRANDGHAGEERGEERQA